MCLEFRHRGHNFRWENFTKPCNASAMKNAPDMVWRLFPWTFHFCRNIRTASITVTDPGPDNRPQRMNFKIMDRKKELNFTPSVSETEPSQQNHSLVVWIKVMFSSEYHSGLRLFFMNCEINSNLYNFHFRFIFVQVLSRFSYFFAFLFFKFHVTFLLYIPFMLCSLVFGGFSWFFFIFKRSKLDYETPTNIWTFIS